MAHLLGSQACIDSLRVDVEDLQNVIDDIVGKTGSMKCHSWKFPDKLATDLDISELLQRYQHGKHEVDNQMSHIVLFELIIDRLLLVLHGSWRYFHELQSNFFPNVTDPTMMINQTTSLSVGLVVKKYWNKLLHFSTILKQNENERKRANLNGTKTAPVMRSKSTLGLEKPSNNTDPCSSCVKLRQNLQDHMDSLINLCHTYNLPSSLAHYRSSKTDLVTIDDINHWSDSQSKDIDRLSKHLEFLNNTLNKTKTDLELNENRLKKQDETNRRLQQLINDDKQAKKVLQDLHDQKISQMKTDLEQREKQIDNLTYEKIRLEQQLKEVQQLCRSREEQIETLESSKGELKVLLDDRMKSDQTIIKLEQDRIRLQTELDLVKKDLEERNRDLQKDRTRIESMIRQEQTYQSKQKSLTNSHETLAEECQNLKKQLNELEIARDELEKQLNNTKQNHRVSTADREELRTLRETNEQGLEEIQMLRAEIEELHQQIEQMDEREQMLVQYPDLNGPIEHEQMTNNLVLDMQNQIRTNEIRIDLLRKQNQSLRASLEKLMHAQQNPSPSRVTEERYEELRSQSSQRRYSYSNETTPPPPPVSKPKPTPLWALNNEILEQQQAFTETRPAVTSHYIPRFSENDYVANGWIKAEPDVISLTPSNDETKPADRSYSSHSIRTTQPTTNVDERNANKDLIITAESRPPSGAHSTSRSMNNGRTSTLPPPSDYEMIIGKGRATSRPSSAAKNRHHSATDTNRRDATLPKSTRTTTSAKAQRSATNLALHQCATCQKSYDDKRNFDIHKLYCKN